MTKVLIIGSGAREHAIAKVLNRAEDRPTLYCCGSARNPGIEELTAAYWVGNINQVDVIVQVAIDWQISLAIIGPEAPLEQGLADALWDKGIAVVGPKKKLAQIETSKSFARDLMQKYAIPGLPKFQTFKNLQGVAEFLSELGELNYVVKANGLMGGKGVKVAGDHLHSFAEALAYCSEIFAQNQTVLIEEKLVGQEFSFMCFSDGNSLAAMPLVQDNKRAFADDKGPNTGGMGSFSAADHKLPFLTADEVDQALQINQLVMNALQKEMKERYIGILYGGFIATASGVYVIEFNARFGDPEALNVLSILESDFLQLAKALVKGELASFDLQFAAKGTVCKYTVPLGYPDNPVRETAIDISAVRDKEHLYLSAVNSQHGILYATGSRTAAYVGIAEELSEAEEKAEAEIGRIKGQLFHRHDIGTESLITKRIQFMRRVRESCFA